VGVAVYHLLLSYIEEAHTKHTPEEHTPFISKFNLPSLLAKTTSSSESDFNLMGTQLRSLQTTKTNFIAALLFAWWKREKKSQL
jgi:hypothetical protein